jgi:nucleoid-associated protein EbfC
MGGMMKRVMEMKENMAQIKEELGELTVEASSGGGMVTAVCTGKFEVLSVKIDPEIIDKDDPEMLETLVTAAVNEAVRKAQQLVKEKVAEVTGGIDIPGLT